MKIVTTAVPSLCCSYSVVVVIFVRYLTSLPHVLISTYVVVVAIDHHSWFIGEVALYKVILPLHHLDTSLHIFPSYPSYS